MARNGIVRWNVLLDMAAELHNKGNGAAAERFKELEPALYNFLNNTITHNAGVLLLNGAPAELIGEASSYTMTTFLAAFLALQQAQYRLWMKDLPGTPLGKLYDEWKEKPQKQNGGHGNDEQK